MGKEPGRALEKAPGAEKGPKRVFPQKLRKHPKNPGKRLLRQKNRPNRKKHRDLSRKHRYSLPKRDNPGPALDSAPENRENPPESGDRKIPGKNAFFREK